MDIPPSDASGTCGSPPSASPASTGYFLAAISKSRVLSHESASFRSPLANGPPLLVPEDLAEVEVQGLVTYGLDNLMSANAK